MNLNRGDFLRIEWLDSSRGIAILLVVIFHGFLSCEGIFHEINSRLCCIIVPIFFVISGFLFRNRSLNEFLKSRSRRILIPYFTAQTIVTILAIQFFPDAQNRPIDYLIGIFCADVTLPTDHSLADYPLWFLPCLFVAELIFLLSRQKILVAILISMLGIFCPIHLPWGIDIALTSQIFLIAGFLLRNRSLNWKLILLALILIPTAELNLTIDMPNRIYNDPILFFIDGIFGSILIFKLSQLISNRLLNFIGRKTLTILILHVPIFYVLEILGLDPTSNFDCWLKILATISIILAIDHLNSRRLFD